MDNDRPTHEQSIFHGWLYPLIKGQRVYKYLVNRGTGETRRYWASLCLDHAQTAWAFPLHVEFETRYADASGPCQACTAYQAHINQLASKQAAA